MTLTLTSTTRTGTGPVLLTGATGFVGMELLVRVLEQTDREVIALVRATDDAAAELRIDELLEMLIAPAQRRALRQRVRGVAADLEAPGLGLSESMRDDLTPQVRHDAIMYDTPDALLEAAVPFVEGGLRAGEVVVVQVPEHTWSLLKPQLASAQRIMHNPLDDVHGHPHQTLWGLKQLVEEEVRDGAAAVRGLAEIPPTRLTADYADWGRTEALLNTALGRVDYWGLCPYSRNDLSPAVIDMAVRTHPWLVDSGNRHENPAFGQARSKAVPQRVGQADRGAVGPVLPKCERGPSTNLAATDEFGVRAGSVRGVRLTAHTT